MIATLWFPDPNPIGTPSIVACCIVATLLFLTSRISPLSEVWRRRVTLASPLFLLIVCAFTQGSVVSSLLSPRQFPDAAHLTATILYDAAGLVLAFKNLRYRGSLHQACALVFALVYGLFLAFRIAWWGPGDLELGMSLFTFFIPVWILFVWYFTQRPGRRLAGEEEAPGSRARRLQFSMGELLVATLVLAGLFGLLRMTSDWVRRCAVRGFDSMLRQELGLLNLALYNARDTLDGARVFEEDDVDHYLSILFPEWTSVDEDLGASGYDVSRMDSSEALVFLLAGVPDPKQPGGFGGFGPDPQHPLKPGGWRSEPYYDFSWQRLTDRDGDGWSEYVLRSRIPSYADLFAPKLFMIRNNEVVAIDLPAPEAEGGTPRKMYRLESRELVTSVLPDGAIQELDGEPDDADK